MSKEIFHIAIDGPVASGKGTVAKGLSDVLSIPNLDTGAMYRGLAVYCLDKGVDTKDEAAVLSALKEIKLVVKIEKGTTMIFVNDKDFTPRLRFNEIGQMASNVSVFPLVREKMVSIQQDIAEKESFILEGRDICSVVLPNAKYKFYLTAKIKTRARRRMLELMQKGTEITLRDMIKQIKVRDRQDKRKKVGALKRTRDAVVVDNTRLSTDETVKAFLLIMGKN
jgi:cytidylate kinase